MDQKLRFEYDKLSDTLSIEKCARYLAQDEDEIDELVVGRFNPDTRDLESVDIIFFMDRLKRDGHVLLPITADFKLAIKADA